MVIGIAFWWVPAYLAAAVMFFVGHYLGWAPPFLFGNLYHALS